MNQTAGFPQIRNATPDEINRVLRQIYERMDAVQGKRGDPTIERALSMSQKSINDLAAPESAHDAVNLDYLQRHYIPRATPLPEDSTVTSSTGSLKPPAAYQSADPPTLALTSIIDGFEVTITPPNDPLGRIVGYDVYIHTSDFTDKSAANFLTYKSSAPIGIVGTGSAPVSSLKVQAQVGNTTQEYWFGAISVTAEGYRSALSARVHGIPLATLPPTQAAKPDPPIVGVSAEGFQSDFGSYQFKVGIAFSSTIGQGGCTKSHLQMVPTGTSWDVVTGFAIVPGMESLERDSLPRPPYVATTQVSTYGKWDFSARLYNEIANEWSNWSSPISKETQKGTQDLGVPGCPVSFKIANLSAQSLGHDVQIQVQEPDSNAKTIWGYDFQANGTLFDDTVSNTTGLKGILLGGPTLGEETGTIVITGNTLTDLAKSWSTDQWAGKVLYIYRSMNLTTGTIVYPFGGIIATNTATVITMAGTGVFQGLNEETGSVAVKYIIADGWIQVGTDIDYAASPMTFFNQLRAVPGTHPDAEHWVHTFKYSRTGYWRVRAKNYYGCGQWFYWDGGTGTANKASAVTFTPTYITTDAIGNLQITTGKLADAAVTAVKQARGTLPSNVNIEWTATSNIKISWGNGTVFYPDGTSEAFASGDTGNLSTDTTYWIYKIVGNSTLQVTSSPETAVGDNKVPIAVLRTTSVAGEKATVQSPWGGSILTAARIIVGDLAALNSTAVIFTAGLIRTAASGARIQTDSTNGVQSIDSSGNTRVRMPTSGTSLWFRADDTNPGWVEFGDYADIYCTAAGNLTFETVNLLKQSRLTLSNPTTNPMFSLAASFDTTYTTSILGSTTAASSSVSAWLNGTKIIECLNDAGSVKLGFFAVTPVTRPDITGVRNANPALADFLTKVASLGLISDSTTAGNSPFDASNISSGTLSTDRFSAYADLGAEGKIGTGATQVAAGDHTHPGMGYGDVVGPASATDHAIARFDGTTGKIIENSSVTIDDNGLLEVSSATAPQMKISNAANYATFGMDTTGLLTIIPTGGFVLYADPGQGTRSILAAQRTISNAAAVYGYNIDLHKTGTGGVAGILSFVYADSTTSTGAVEGAYLYTKISGSYSTPNEYGLRVLVENVAGASVTTDLVGIQARLHGQMGSITGKTAFFYARNTITGGTMPTLYGLYVEPLTQGTSNYAIYTGGSTPSYFGGNVGIGKTPATALDVNGTVTATAFAGSGANLTDVMIGPGNTTDNLIARFDGTTGKVIDDSGIVIDDSGHLLPWIGANQQLGTGANYWGSAYIDSVVTNTLTTGANPANVAGNWKPFADNTYSWGNASYRWADIKTVLLNGSAPGNVVGPASATDNAIIRFDGTTGNVIQNSSVTIDDSNNVAIPGTLLVSGVGPHAIGAAGQDYTRLYLAGNFTSGGGSNNAALLRIGSQLTGASGDTSYLVGCHLGGTIVTQASDTIALVSQVRIDYPGITKGGGATITEACTLYISGAPTEGAANYAFHVANGNGLFSAHLTCDGTLYTGPILPSTDNTSSIGSMSKHYVTGYIYNLIANYIGPAAGDLTVGGNAVPSSGDNTGSLGKAGTRWADVRTVLINGSDICLANGWKLREYPATKEDIGKPDIWFREHAKDGIQFLDGEERLLAVLHRNGTLYVKDVKPLSDLLGRGEEHLVSG